jgi:class 3 adenylate cyclase
MAASDDTTPSQLHDQLEALLPTARADNCQVVATFLDVRGFSSYAEIGDTSNVAAYLRAVYATILRRFFSDRTFFKPTGDGLLLIHELVFDKPGEWPLVIQGLLERCIALVAEFPRLTVADLSVTPPVPSDIGIGMSRGSATKLNSGSVILDYTGRPLNRAARLMDKARPRGVAFYDTHPDLVLGGAHVASLFQPEAVCLRGIAESEPITIFVTDNVVIDPRDREPINDPQKVFGEKVSLTVAEVRSYGSYPFLLPRRPGRREDVGVRVDYETFVDGESQGWYQRELHGEPEQDEDGWHVRIKFDQVKRLIVNSPEKDKLWIFNPTVRVSFIPFIAPPHE